PGPPPGTRRVPAAIRVGPPSETRPGDYRERVDVMTLEPAFMSSRSGFRRKPAGLVTEHLGREMHRRSTTDAAFSRPKRGTPWRTKVPGRDRSDRIRRAQTIVAVQADCSIARARALMQNVA